MGKDPAFEFSHSGRLEFNPSDCILGGATTVALAWTTEVAFCALSAAVNRAITSSPSPIA